VGRVRGRLVVPASNGKGSVLEALEIAALFLADPDAPPPLILHSAHEFKTSAEHFRRVRDLVEGTAAEPSRCGSSGRRPARRRSSFTPARGSGS
jgi:hypothetical protein